MGNNGTILRTINGGSAWSIQESNTTVFLRSVFFVDSLNGYSVGDNGRIIKSNDGGLNWKVQSNGTNLLLSNVFFINEEIGWVVGGNLFTGTIMKTTDSGLTWRKMIDSTAGSFRAVHFRNDKEGWVVGARSLFDNLEPNKILHTTDGGTTWYDFSDRSKPGPLVDVHFLNRKFGWASGFSPTAQGILYTNNSGLTWEYRRIQHGDLGWGDYYRSMAVVDSNNIWVATDDTIYQSSNGGISWETNSMQSQKHLGSIYFVDKKNGWAVGVEGSIWKYDGNIVSIKDENLTSNKKLILENCFPNPANPTTHIKYFVEKETFVKLKLYNSLGQEVITFVNEHKLPGSYEVVFDGSKLSSGVYFYRLESAGKAAIQKMLLLK